MVISDRYRDIWIDIREIGYGSGSLSKQIFELVVAFCSVSVCVHSFLLSLLLANTSEISMAYLLLFGS